MSLRATPLSRLITKTDSVVFQIAMVKLEIKQTWPNCVTCSRQLPARLSAYCFEHKGMFVVPKQIRAVHAMLLLVRELDRAENGIHLDPTSVGQQ